MAQPTGDRIHIRELTTADSARAVEVINIAARWYQEFLAPEELHDPEMDEEQWVAEGQRMTWWGVFMGQSLIGVMGSEPIGKVALLRHAYIHPQHQRQGVGSALRAHIEARLCDIERVIVGTYGANYKARGVLEKAGYALSADSQEVLRNYFDIPEDRLLTSVTYEKFLRN